MKVVFFGTPDFAVPTLERLLVASRARGRSGRVAARSSPVGRTTDRDVAAGGRGGSTAAGIESVQPAKLKDRTGYELGAGRGRRGCGSGGGLRQVDSRRTCSTFRAHGFINLHPSLLPRHRGPSPIQWSLVCGDRATGVTTMMLDEGMDTGPILLQERVPIEDRRDRRDAGAPARRARGRSHRKHARRARGRNRDSEPQPTDGVNVTPMLRRNFAKVDWIDAGEPAGQPASWLHALAGPLHEISRRTPEDLRPRRGQTPAVG